MSTSQILENFLDNTPMGIIFLDPYDYVLVINQYACTLFNYTREEVEKRKLFDKFPGIFTPQIKNQPTSTFSIKNTRYLLETKEVLKNDKASGMIMMFRKMTDVEELAQEADVFRELSADLQAIFDISYDVIYVSDANGVTQRVSAASEKLWGVKEQDLIGKSIYELEKKEIFKPSITRLILEKKEKVTRIQTTKTGRKLMVIGTPIFNDQGKIVRIVNASRDITEVSRLQSEIEELRHLSEGYRKELMDLRSKDELETQIIYRSQQMREIIHVSKKIAQSDMTVLLSGESGVGKELLAFFIHKWSPRRVKPFVTFHSASISESLLETELLGSEYDQKMGLFEMAHEGTLFLDEISSMPLSLQAKLLRIIENMEVVRTNGTHAIPINVRIIASTNHDLQEEIAAGRFREDLYYRLFVAPIEIPPLRQREDDISALIYHFSSQNNVKYHLQKKFSARAMAKLQKYDWPGNVRELQNTMERLVVTQEKNVIEEDDLPKHIIGSKVKEDVEVNRIIPLKEGVNLVERNILALAKKRYGSTTRMAQALGVNQSTISRKLIQYKL